VLLVARDQAALFQLFFREVFTALN
jgi:hypothetical protein